MDLVSIETPSENDLIEELIAGGNDKIMDPNWVVDTGPNLGSGYLIDTVPPRLA